MKPNYFIYITAASLCVLTSCSKSDIVSEDTTSPVITMLGKNPDTMIVKTAASYSDPGATAMDDVDGDITNKIVVAPQPYDLNNEGSFNIRYNVEDNAHNPAPTLTRTVKVVKADGIYDVSENCNSAGAQNVVVSVSSNNNNDTITIIDFPSTGSSFKAALSNYSFVIYHQDYVQFSIEGNITAVGTTLNASYIKTINIGPGITDTCTASFIRH